MIEGHGALHDLDETITTEVQITKDTDDGDIKESEYDRSLALATMAQFSFEESYINVILEHKCHGHEPVFRAVTNLATRESKFRPIEKNRRYAAQIVINYSKLPTKHMNTLQKNKILPLLVSLGENLVAKSDGIPADAVALLKRAVTALKTRKSLANPPKKAFFNETFPTTKGLSFCSSPICNKFVLEMFPSLFFFLLCVLSFPFFSILFFFLNSSFLQLWTYSGIQEVLSLPRSHVLLS
jgi:hypothetical protein